MNRITTLGLFGKFATALIGVVVIEGILSVKFKVFASCHLPLICCFYYGFTLSTPIASIVLGSTLGLMQDSLSGGILGANGFSKTLIGFLAASAGQKFAVDQLITRVFALFLFSLGDDILVTILALVVGPTSNPTYSGAMGSWLLSATFNTLFGLVLFGYHDRWRDATT